MKIPKSTNPKNTTIQKSKNKIQTYRNQHIPTYKNTNPKRNKHKTNIPQYKTHKNQKIHKFENINIQKYKNANLKIQK